MCRVLSSHRWPIALAAFGALSLSSCGGGGSTLPKKTCYPATGKVTVKSQPAAGALVVLRPQAGDDPNEWWAGFPRGVAATDGSYTLETYGEKDGAPQGDYVVLVTWPAPAEAGAEEGTMNDRLQGKFTDAATSQFKVKIEAGPTKIPPINIP